MASAAVTSIHMTGRQNFQRANIICLNIHSGVSGNCILLINMAAKRQRAEEADAGQSFPESSINQAAFAASSALWVAFPLRLAII